ncbi:MAG: dihydrolipoamide acetyltransferase family protein [Chitinophagaceae bacterium]
MAIVDLVMPKMGESIMEATVLKWLKKPGDSVKQDETLLEIATDKVDSEVPSTAEGILQAILFDVNDVVPVGAVIATIQTDAAEIVSLEQPVSGVLNQGVPETTATTGPDELFPHNADQSTDNTVPVLSMNKFYSPLVLNIAASEGIDLSEMEKISGSGNEGRVTKKDILQYVENRKNVNSDSPPEIVHSKPRVKLQEEEIIPVNHELSSPYTGNVEIVEMDRMRRLISDHMVRSKQTSAHVTSFSEADVTNMVIWREKIKNEFEKREGVKITFTPLFIEAIVKCIRKYPLINSSVDGNKIIIKKDINIGMATALNNGNLIVPVIKNAGQFNLVGLTKQVNSLADNARSNRLKPEDTQGGSFTLTNVGSFGSLMGTPIINQPQVAILAVGVIKKRPVVVETPMGDSIAIRHMMYLSMSYDHRIIDGSLGATFLTSVANELENFNPNRNF